MSSDPPEAVVALPKKIEDLFAETEGNQFASINSPISGPRTDVELESGSSEYQLYSRATPNGQKVGIALEEMEIDYDAHFVYIEKGDQFSTGFYALNPNSQIPCMRHGDVRLFETGSILLYLAEQTGRFVPKNPKERAECLNWVFWASASQAPFFGQFGHFYRYAPRNKIETIKYGVARYGMEVQRKFSLLDRRLAETDYVSGSEYTIADMAVYPWVKVVERGYPGADEFLSTEKYLNVARWKKRIEKRAAVQRGMRVCSRAPSKL